MSGSDRPTSGNDQAADGRRSSRWDLSQVDGDAAFLAILALLGASVFVVTPLEADGSVAPALVEAARFAIASLVFLIVAKRRLSRLLILVAFAATTIVFWRDAPSLGGGAIVRPAMALVFDLSILAIVAASTFRPGFVSTRRILGGIVIYLCIALAFAQVYAIAEACSGTTFVTVGSMPRAGFADLLDFSLASLTSIGEARVATGSALVQSLSRLETVTGQLFPATLLARLVGLNAAMAIGHASRSPTHPGDKTLSEDEPRA